MILVAVHWHWREVLLVSCFSSSLCTQQQQHDDTLDLFVALVYVTQ